MVLLPRVAERRENLQILPAECPIVALLNNPELMMIVINYVFARDHQKIILQEL